MAEDKQANILNIFGRFSLMNIDEELAKAGKTVDDWCKGNKKTNEKCTDDIEENAKGRMESVLDLVRGSTLKLAEAFGPAIFVYAFTTWKEIVDKMIHENSRFVDSYAEIYEFMAAQGVPFGIEESAEAFGFMASKGQMSIETVKDLATQSLELSKSLGMSVSEAGDLVHQFRDINKFEARQMNEMASAILNVADASKLSVQQVAELSKEYVKASTKFIALADANDDFMKRGVAAQKQATEGLLALAGAQSQLNLESAKITDLVKQVGEGGVEAMRAETALAHLTGKSVQEVRTLVLAQGKSAEVGIMAIEGIQKEMRQLTAGTQQQLMDIDKQMQGLSDDSPVKKRLEAQKAEIMSTQGVIVANYQKTFEAITGTQIEAAELMRLAAAGEEDAAKALEKVQKRMADVNQQAKVRERVMKDVNQLIAQIGRIGQVFMVVIGSRLVRWILPAVTMIADVLQKIAGFMGTYADMTTEAGEGTNRIVSGLGIIVNLLIDAAAMGSVFLAMTKIVPLLVSGVTTLASRLGFSATNAAFLGTSLQTAAMKAGMLLGKFMLISMAIGTIKDVLKKLGLVQEEGFFDESFWDKALNVLWLFLLPLNWIKKGFKFIFDLFKGNLNVIQKATDLFRFIPNVFREITMNVGNFFSSIKAIFTSTDGFIVNFLTKIKNFGSIFKSAAKLIGKNILKFIGGALKFALTKVPGIGAIIGILFDYRKIIDAFKTGGIVEGLKQLLWSAFSGLLLGIPDLLMWIVDKVFGEGTGTKIKDWLWSVTFGWLMDWGYALGDMLGGMIEKLFSSDIVSALMDLGDLMWNVLTTPWQWILDMVGSIGDFFIEGFSSKVDAIKDVIMSPFDSAWDALSGWFTGESPSELSLQFLEGFKAIGGDLLGSLLSPFTMAWDTIKAIFNAIGIDIMSPFKMIFETAQHVFPQILGVVQKIIESAFGGTAGKLFTKALGFLGFDLVAPESIGATPTPVNVPVAEAPTPINPVTGAPDGGDTIVNLNQAGVENLLKAMLQELASMRMMLAQQQAANNPVSSLAL